MLEHLSQPATVERSVQKKLHALVREEIKKRQLSIEALARELDLLPSGAQALMERQVWPIETALRVAERLKIKMELEPRSTE